MKKPLVFPNYFSIAIIGFLILVNLQIGLQIFRNPNPFPSSYWDIRWAFLFTTAIICTGLLFALKQYKLLIILTLLGVITLILIPIFTIGAAPALLMILLLVLIALGIGEQIIRLIFKVDEAIDSLECSVLSILIGLGFIMILVMIQGWLHAFHPIVTWLGLVVLFFFFVVPNIKRWSTDLMHGFQNLHRTWLQSNLSGWALTFSLLLILLIPTWLIALSPAIRYDEMSYHLSGPMLYLHEGGIVPFPEGGNNVWLHYAEMLYTLALQTAGQPLPRLLHLLMGVISILLIYLFGRRLMNKRVGIIAAILFTAVPVVGYETGTAYIDLFITAYTTAFGFTLFVWWQERHPRWWLIAGLLGGFGLGIKLTAAPILVSLLGIVFLYALIERQIHNVILWIVTASLLIAGLALPWLIRDALLTGDPFYPYGSMFLQKIGVSNIQSGAIGETVSLSKADQILNYPIDLVFNSFPYYTEAAGGMASALPLLAVPFFIFNSYITRRVKVVGLVLLLASAIAVILMFLSNNALIRYALPIFPWLAVCAAINTEGLYCWITNGKGHWVSISLLSVALIYLASTRLPLIVRLYDNLPQRFPVSYFLGRESRDEYLSRNLAVYDAYRYIDSEPGGMHRVLSIGNEFRLYVQSRIDGVYDVAEANTILSGAKSSAELAQLLEQSGYDYILLNQPEIDFRYWKYLDPYPILKGTDFFNLYCELVYAKNGIYVFRFFPKGVNLPPANNLLVNSGFEIINGKTEIMNWDMVGNPELSSDAYKSNTSILLNGPLSDKGYSYIFQRVPIDEGKLYTIGYWIKSEQPGTFLLQVKWLDEQGNVKGGEQFWKNTTSTWQWYDFFSQAPKGTRFSEVYASLGGAGSAWVDDVCLAQGQRCPTQ